MGDLLLEMMERKSPPPASPPHGAGNLELSSRRIPDPSRREVNASATRSPECPAPKEVSRKSPGLSGTQPDTLTDLLERAALSEEQRSLMSTVFEKI